MGIEKIMAIAKRRGFFYPSSEIHSSIAGFWNYGPLGVILKKKIENEWRDFFVKAEDFYELEGTLIMPESVFIASGHLSSFADPLVQCKKCKSLHRVDKLIEEKTGTFIPERTSTEKFDEVIKEKKIKCPSCGGGLTNTRFFNMMFKINVGPTEEGETAYLRPETCQTIFVDFLNVHRSMRTKLPFGIAQIGRSFRNEISPRQGLLRQREFTQAEAEIFFNPEKANEFPSFEKIKNQKLNLQMQKDEKPRKITVKDAVKDGLIKNKLVAYYLLKLQQFINSLGIPLKAIRFREQTDEERPFYAEYAFDCEVETSTGWIEVVANHYRGDYDLSSHMKVTKKDLSIIENGAKIIPHVWEISEGIDRTLYVMLLHSFVEDEKRGWDWLKFPPKIAPFQSAVYPLVSKDDLPKKAMEIYETLKKDFDVIYDEAGSIGKRYARSDEIGIPFAVTIDHQTLKDNTVTLRDRNSTQQKRVKIKELARILRQLINEEIELF